MVHWIKLMDSCLLMLILLEERVLGLVLMVFLVVLSKLRMDRTSLHGMVLSTFFFIKLD